MNANQIALSVIVRVVGGGPFLERCLTHLVPQAVDQRIEIIVPYDSTVDSVRKLALKFPQVTFQDMGTLSTPSYCDRTPHWLFDLRTTAGLRVARGQIIASIEDYAIPNHDWCQEILQAHQLDHGVIGGAVEHSGRGDLNWALYFLDFERYGLPLPEGPVAYLSDVNVSYKRTVLEATRRVWQERYNEVTLHWALAAGGVTLWQRPSIVVFEDRGELRLKNILRERFEWGRVFGFMRIQECSLFVRICLIAASPLIPLVLIARIFSRVRAKRQKRLVFFKALPVIAVLAVAWSLGELAAYITGREISSRNLAVSV